MSDAVNTGFILDMQRKLYRWSVADPDKRFADLFNVVCDCGTLVHAWQWRLARNRRHPVTGTPAKGIISPLLANVYLTAIDERYRRWVPNPRDKTRERAQQRLQSDYKRGRPGFYVVRYADDFVVLVQGTQQDAEQTRLALAQFLKEELRMELSMEKTKITDVREGFDFLGYRIAQERMPSTERHVGMLFIPKSKSQLLRDKIKAKVRETPTDRMT